MMKKRLSCFIEQLRRFWAVLFSLVIFSLSANINTFALRNCIGHELIINHFPENIVHKALTTVASQKMSLLLAYKPDTMFFIDNNEKVYVSADSMPQFPGGEKKLAKYLSKNIKIPPLSDNKNGKSVFVGFIVDTTGNLLKVKLIKRTLDSTMNQEALRLVENMPRWNPGMINGRKVPVFVSIPIKFEIADQEKMSSAVFTPGTEYLLDNNETERVYIKVDQMPDFPGGLTALNEFYSQNLHYPEQGLQNNNPIVYVGFIVDTNGILRKARIVQSAGKALDKEALRVVRKMPNWKPGKLKGSTVPVYFILPVSFAKSALVRTQNDTLQTGKTSVYIRHKPEFPGGDSALIQFLSENIKYPIPAMLENIQGTVVLRFVVNADGKISDIQVMRGIGGGCDEEAIRVVKMMPKWKPGLENGKPVRVYFVLPIKFTLRSKN